MSAPLSAIFEHGSSRFTVEAARYGSINLAISSFYSFLAELSVRGEFWHPRRGDVVIDAGAAFGAYSLPAMVDGARVFSFEPDPELFQALTANIARNVAEGFTASWVPGWDVSCFRTALSDRSGSLLYDADDRGLVFDAVTLDSLNLDRLDWIKSDTEGHEGSVLIGGAGTIRRCRPNILLESHRFIRPDETEVLLAALVLLGYARDSIQVLEAGIVDYIFAARGK